VTVGAGADFERHAQTVADVEAGTAHFRELPSRAKVARAPLGIRLEAAAGEDHGTRTVFDHFAVALRFDAEHTLSVIDQRYGARFIIDVDAFFYRGVGQVLN